MNPRRTLALIAVILAGTLLRGPASADPPLVPIPTPAMPRALISPAGHPGHAQIVVPPFPPGLVIPPCPHCDPHCGPATGSASCPEASSCPSCPASTGCPSREETRGDTEQHFGVKVCALKQECKKVTHTVYAVKEVDYCLPWHCACHAGPGCGELRTKRVLVKKMPSEMVRETKCVVQTLSAKEPSSPSCAPSCATPHVPLAAPWSMPHATVYPTQPLWQGSVMLPLPLPAPVLPPPASKPPETLPETLPAAPVLPSGVLPPPSR